MARAAVGSFLAVVLLSSSPVARAQGEPATEDDPPEVAGADAELEALRELATYARYVDADAACTTFLARTDLSAVQRNAGLEMRAVILIARRRLDDARAVLRELFARDPEHRLGYRDAGPNVRDEFDRAREDGVPPLAVSLTDDTAPLETRVAPEITVAIGAGGDAVDDVRLSYRVSGESGVWERALMRHDASTGTAVGRVPLRAGTDAYGLDYYVEVLAPSGATLSSLGSASGPRTLAIPEAPVVVAPTVDPAAFAATSTDTSRGTNVAEEWWFWTIIGVVVAGGVVGGVVGGLSATSSSTPPPGTLGEGRL